MRDLAVEVVPASSLVPSARNPRKNDAAAKRLAETIRVHGWTNPVLAQAGTRRVLAGHTRLKAAAILKMTEVPTIFLDVDDRQADAIMIADNRLGELAEWDEAMLADVLAGLADAGEDIAAIGFTSKEMAALFAAVSDDLPPVSDDVPDMQAEADSVTGSVYELGPHRLVCGDSTDLSAWAMIGSADIVLTDPPYGLGDTASVKNNYSQHEDTKANLEKIAAAVMPLAQTCAPVVVLTPGNLNSRMWPAPAWTMAWFTPAGVGIGPWGFCCWQPILCYGRDPKLSMGLGSHPDAIVHTESAEKNGHPCAKPIGFWTWLLKRTTEIGAVVVDPFGGSGTTLMACAQERRVARLIEIDPRYCDLIRRRWTVWARSAGMDPGTGALD